MLSVHTQADITVQRLLQSDPHLRDAHIFHAIAHLVDRSEIPHLERIVAALLQQMYINWPEPRRPSAPYDQCAPKATRYANGVFSQLEPALSLLMRRAMGRLPNLSSSFDYTEQIRAFSSPTTSCPAAHVRCR